MKKNALFIVIILFLASSCIHGDPTTVTKTVIINKSNTNVEYIVYGNSDVHSIDSISLSINESYTEQYSDVGGTLAFPMYSDSVRIIFNDKKYSLYKQKYSDIEIKRNPFSDKAYSIKMDDYYYEFTYTITEEDYNNAIPLTE